MAKKKSRIFTFIKNLFRKRKHSLSVLKTPEQTRMQPRFPSEIDKELDTLKEKLSNFLITSKIKSGVVVEKKNYTLIKNGANLYRLEGTENTGRKFSIIISTNNTINLNSEGKLTGLIQIQEAELNRAIQNEHSTLKSLFVNFDGLKLDDVANELITGVRSTYNWKIILSWNPFWKQQILLRMSPNTIALLLVSLDNDFRTFFQTIATSKQKQIIADELFFLNEIAEPSQMNPHSKNIGLINFDKAQKELKNSIVAIQLKIERELHGTIR